MRRVPFMFSFVWLLLVYALTVFIGCSSEPDEQLLMKMNAGLQAGSFRNQPEVLNAVKSTFYTDIQSKPVLL